MSKCAAHMAAKSLAADLRPAGVAVATVHPGVVITEMTKRAGSDARLSAAESVRGILARVDALSLACSGVFWDYQGVEMPA